MERSVRGDLGADRRLPPNLTCLGSVCWANRGLDASPRCATGQPGSSGCGRPWVPWGAWGPAVRCGWRNRGDQRRKGQHS